MRISQVNKRIDRQITRTNGTPCENDDRVIKMSFSVYVESGLGSDFIIAVQARSAFHFRSLSLSPSFIFLGRARALRYLATLNSRPVSRQARAYILSVKLKSSTLIRAIYNCGIEK